MTVVAALPRAATAVQQVRAVGLEVGGGGAGEEVYWFADVGELVWYLSRATMRHGYHGCMRSCGEELGRWRPTGRPSPRG
jgi:hypothetical protein